MNSLLFDPRNAFSIEELIARVQQSRFQKEDSEEWNPRDMIIKFKKLGWLFNGYSQQTKFLFHVPQDLKRRFSDVLTGQFKQSLKTTNEPNVYRDEQLLIVDDIFHFLTFSLSRTGNTTYSGRFYVQKAASTNSQSIIGSRRNGAKREHGDSAMAACLKSIRTGFLSSMIIAFTGN